MSDCVRRLVADDAAAVVFFENGNSVFMLPARYVGRDGVDLPSHVLSAVDAYMASDGSLPAMRTSALSIAESRRHD